MKLTKEQIDEIINQQSQNNNTKRIIAPELEKMIGEIIEIKIK